ncbi:MAG: L,D-transpeptidase, partial [bacterium]|nr:L,D-transpeptidase [bacterium]
EDYDERRLRIGRELKLVDLRGAELQLDVDRSRFRVAAWRRTPDRRGWILMAYVPAGLGAEESLTPLGRTKITERVRNPSWTHPETGVTYAPDHEENVLGGYWMRLDDEGLGESGIGLHGYTREVPSSWLGKRASNGCVRLLQADMRRLFHLALTGTPVVIRDGSARPG